ncbi:MAG: EAL domain-containing protein [Alkaliphilus sp.]
MRNVGNRASIIVLQDYKSRERLILMRESTINIVEANKKYVFFNVIYILCITSIFLHSGIASLRSWTIVIPVFLFFNILSAITWLVYKKNNKSKAVKYITTAPLSIFMVYVFLTTTNLASFAILFPVLVSFILYSNTRVFMIFGGFLVAKSLARIIRDIFFLNTPVELLAGQINAVIITVAFVVTTSIIARYIIILTTSLDTKLKEVTEAKEEQYAMLEEISASNVEMEAAYSQLIATEKILHITIDDLNIKKEKLIKSEEKHKLAIEGSRDGIWDWDIVNNTMYLEKSWELLGYSQREHSSTLESWRSLVHPNDLTRLKKHTNDYLKKKTTDYSVKYRIKSKNGKYIWILHQGQAIWDSEGNPTRMAGSHTDVTKEVESQEKIHKLAFIDKLTGLPNKNAFYDFLQKTILKSEECNLTFTILLLDLDGFKLINDSLGHSVGDLVLKKIADTLSGCISDIENCFLARFGGDEFVAIIPNDKGDSAHKIATQILKKFSSTIEVEEYQFHVTASIGLCDYPNNGDSVETLAQNAEVAMYNAKESGRNKFIKYSKDMNESNKRKLEIKNELHCALENKELILHYQPIVENKTGMVVAAEALIRWVHPKRGLVPPNHFISIAEETGQIIKIGEWVIMTALAQCKKWREQGLDQLKMHINISIEQLHHKTLYSFIKKTIDDLGLDAQYIVLEMTESVATNSTDEAIIAIDKLKTLGLSIALDDFGTGYSSLSGASSLPINILKVDKSFIDNLLKYKKDYHVTKLVIDLCRNTNISTTAEGVETAQQRNELLKLKCNNIQGYFFSKPLPAEKFVEYYENNKKKTKQITGKGEGNTSS